MARLMTGFFLLFVLMKIYLIAGEDSGDLHAANLIAALQMKDSNLQFRGVGGDMMEKKGMELIAHVKDINFMGFVEVVKNLGTIKKLFRNVELDIQSYQPDIVVLVDYPGFNLRIAKFIKNLGIPVAYYISPQVWAWKKGRVKKIKAFTDKMMVILPFEQEFYRKEGLEVEFVGHPLLDEIQDRTLTQHSPEKIIALLPGSRQQEIKRMLPLMLELIPHYPDCTFVLAGAPSQTYSFYKSLTNNAYLTEGRLEIRMNQTYQILEQAHAALVTSGTATLETALFNVPEVVVYKGSPISYEIGKRLVNVDYISLVNLILEKEAVKELIQYDYTVENVKAALDEIMDGQGRANVLKNYDELWIKLGSRGASERAATTIMGMLGKKEG